MPHGASAIFVSSRPRRLLRRHGDARVGVRPQGAATESPRSRIAFSVLFFVGGMLLTGTSSSRPRSPSSIVLLIIMLGKGLAAFGLVYVLRYPLHTAITAFSPHSAQIGESSFILTVRPRALAQGPTTRSPDRGRRHSVDRTQPCHEAHPRHRQGVDLRWAWARVVALREAPFERVSNETPAEKLANQDRHHGVLSRLLPPLATVSQGRRGCRRHRVDHDLATELDKLERHGHRRQLADPQAMVAAHLKNAGMLMILDNSTTSPRIAEAARAGSRVIHAHHDRGS